MLLQHQNFYIVRDTIYIYLYLSFNFHLYCIHVFKKYTQNKRDTICCPNYDVQKSLLIRKKIINDYRLRFLTDLLEN